MSSKPAEQRFSFDEFKLYYESAEKVTDRRHETNRWNYSICIAMLVAVAVITKWSLTSTALLWIGLAAVATLSGMAVLFCALWVGQIRDSKNLNTAKFEVLNDMAPHLLFDPEQPGTLVSYCPFRKEWDKLDKLKALRGFGKPNIVALKSSSVEYFIPKAFAVLFGGILIALTSVIIWNWPPAKLVQPAPQSASPTPVQGRHP